MTGPGAAVTVVIPVWDDYVRFLPDAVESVRRNAPGATIVVVDNASSTSLPRLEGCEIARAERRLTVGAARNLGLERVVTDYVVFLDADDMLLEGNIDSLVDRLSSDRGLNISASSILDGETGERHRNPRHFVPRLARRPYSLALAESVWPVLPIQGCAVLRSAQVREAGGYADADLGEDWALAASLAWRGRIEVSDRLGLLYRAPDASRRSRARTAKELRASARRVRRRLRRDPGVPPTLKMLTPAIAAIQVAAIHAARPAYLALRRLRTKHSDIR